jgi:alpha,alpha-trehalose phosphorylase
MLPLPYNAVLFDLDGVMTSTPELHARCWKRTFDEILAAADPAHVAVDDLGELLP